MICCPGDISQCLETCWLSQSYSGSLGISKGQRAGLLRNTSQESLLQCRSNQPHTSRVKLRNKFISSVSDVTVHQQTDHILLSWSLQGDTTERATEPRDLHRGAPTSWLRWALTSPLPWRLGGHRLILWPKHEVSVHGCFSFAWNM